MLDRPEARVAAFPSLLLLLCSAWIGLLRTGRPLWRTVVAIAGTSGCLLTLLLLGPNLPLATELSVWRPAALFGEGLLLVLDAPVWGIAWAICGLGLATMLSRVGETGPNGVALTGATVLAAFGLMAAFAGNLLTLIIGWSLIGACRLGWWILASDAELGPAGLAQLGGREIAPPLLLMMVAFLNQLTAGTHSLIGRLPSETGALLFVLAVIIRAGPLALDETGARGLARLRTSSAAFQAIPAAAALAGLSRVTLPEPPSTAVLAGGWLGFLVLSAGLLGWGRHKQQVSEAGWLAWSLTGLGVMLASAGIAEAVRALTHLVILLAGLQSFSQGDRARRRLWQALAFLAVVGVPGLPGAGISMALSRRIFSGQQISLFVLVGAAGMTMVAARLFPGWSTWRARLPVRGTDLASLALAAASVVGSLLYGWTSSGPGLLLSAATGGAALALAWFFARQPRITARWSLSDGPWSGVFHGVRSAAAVAATGSQHAIRAVATLFEGRAGILWMFLVLLAAWLALQV